MSISGLEDKKNIFENIIWLLLICQILFTLCVTGKHVIFNSNLQLWASPGYFLHQKLAMMLGGDYVIGQRAQSLPADANYLIISTRDIWFINYYLVPRKLFAYPDAIKEQDFSKVPKKWLKDKNISFVLFYDIPNVRLMQLDPITKEIVQ